MKLWAGQTISELGSRITRDGLPLAAVLVLGATPAQMGVLTALGSAVVLFASLPAGVWVDRLRRRPIMIAADAGRAALLMLIPIAAFSHQFRIELLVVVMAVVGVLTVLFDAAYEAYLPALIERRHLMEGNSKLALSSSLAEVLGPGLAGFLIQLLTAPLAIFFDALSFLASIVSLILIRQREPRPAPPEQRRHLAREMMDGLRFVWHEPHLRAMALSGGTRSFFGNFIGVLYALFAIRELGLGAAALGLTISMGGLGSLIGAALAERTVKRYGIGGALIGTTLAGGGFTLLIPLAGGSLSGAMLMLMIAQLCGDAFSTLSFITAVSLRQSIAPDRLLGRTSTAMQVLIAGVAPIGALAGGLLAEAIGVRATLLIAGIGIMLSTGWLILSPIRSLRGPPDRAALPEEAP
jgi:predicted MFS family arabinose efflux permease